MADNVHTFSLAASILYAVIFHPLIVVAFVFISLAADHGARYQKVAAEAVIFHRTVRVVPSQVNLFVVQFPIENFLVPASSHIQNPEPVL